MMIKLAAKKPALLKVKTGLKAGEHCKDAFRDLIRNPSDFTNRQFLNCCEKDNRCLQ